jgi:hypothetical protein
MKKLLPTILVVIFGLPLLAQEVRFPPSILSAGGSSVSSTVSSSRWRLSQVHIITLPEEVQNEKESNDEILTVQDWNVNIYPNPVEDFLFLDFELPESREFLIKITDVSGRVVFLQEPLPFINGANIELNLSGYVPALYLLQVLSPDLKSQMTFRIQKI